MIALLLAAQLVALLVLNVVAWRSTRAPKSYEVPAYTPTRKTDLPAPVEAPAAYQPPNATDATMHLYSPGMLWTGPDGKVFRLDADLKWVDF